MKNKSVVKLDDYSDKGSWFRILPRGKIKVSGEKVRNDAYNVCEGKDFILFFICTIDWIYRWSYNRKR